MPDTKKKHGGAREGAGRKKGSTKTETASKMRRVYPSSDALAVAYAEHTGMSVPEVYRLAVSRLPKVPDKKSDPSS